MHFEAIVFEREKIPECSNGFLKTSSESHESGSGRVIADLTDLTDLTVNNPKYIYYISKQIATEIELECDETWLVPARI